MVTSHDRMDHAVLKRSRSKRGEAAQMATKPVPTPRKLLSASGGTGEGHNLLDRRGIPSTPGLNFPMAWVGSFKAASLQLAQTSNSVSPNRKTC